MEQSLKGLLPKFYKPITQQSQHMSGSGELLEGKPMGRVMKVIRSSRMKMWIIILTKMKNLGRMITSCP